MDTTDEVKITFDDLKGYLSKNYELVYIAYDDNLDNSLDKVQEAIQKQDYEPLDSILFDNDWFDDCTWESVNQIIRDLKDELERDYEFDEGELDELIDANFDQLRQEIEDRDNSTPLSDLIRHTSDPVCFYDTGVYLDESWGDNQLFGANLRQIKRVLKIHTHDYDDNLRLMLSQASYGGHLVIYFSGDIEKMMKIESENWNTVTFKNPMIAIIDMFNGSGDHVDLPGHELSLLLDPKFIFFDKTFKYSYTYDVCGMYSDWCNCTDVEFSKEEKPKKKAKQSSLHAENEREAQYNKTFKEGGCTHGDIDMNRHRNTYYLNEFPCGTHCPHCGMFWID